MDESLKSDDVWPAIRLPLELSPDLVHVIRVRLDLPFIAAADMNAILSDDERQRAVRFRFDEPRQRFATCRTTLRKLLGSCCGILPNAVPLRYGDHGKPELSFTELEPHLPRIEFSVSHSGDLGLIAITKESAVGIDIEECNPAVKTLRLAQRFFAPPEAAELSQLPPEKQLAGFYRGWTCKEAYIKATGLGMSLSLSSFCVTIDPDQPASLHHVVNQPTEPQRWTIQSGDVAPNYAAAVMVAHPHCRIACWNWPSG